MSNLLVCFLKRRSSKKLLNSPLNYSLGRNAPNDINPSSSSQVEEIKEYPEIFVYDSCFRQGNFYYRVAESGVYDYTSMVQYIYNALPIFDSLMEEEFLRGNYENSNM